MFNGAIGISRRNPGRIAACNNVGRGLSGTKRVANYYRRNVDFETGLICKALIAMVESLQV